MSFEVFQQPHKRVEDEPRKQHAFVALRPYSIYINRHAFGLFGKSDAKYVQLLYDAERRIVGIRAVADDANGAYELKGLPDRSCFSVSGRAFYSYFRLRVWETTRYTVDMEGDILCVYLDKPV